MKNLVKELTEGMQRLCAVANRIVAQNGRVSRIESDLLLADLRQLYDVALQMNGDVLPEAQPSLVEESEAEPRDEEKMMAMMSTLAAMAPAPEEPQVEHLESEPEVFPEPVAEEPVVEPEPIKPEPMVEPEPVAEEPAPAPEPVAPLRIEEPAESDNALLFDEVFIEPEPTPAFEPAPAPAPEPIVAPDPEPVVEKMGTQASLLDYLNQPTGRTIGESIGGQTLGQSLEGKVSDLRTVININEKFSFMSELFRGNMKAYNDFIMRLNVTQLRDEALAYVNEVAKQYQWDEGSLAVKNFYKIFDKKF